MDNKILEVSIEEYEALKEKIIQVNKEKKSGIEKEQEKADLQAQIAELEQQIEAKSVGESRGK